MKNGLARLPSPLLLITDRKQARRPLLEILESALGRGCRWVSIREKDVSHDERISLVRQVLPVVRRFGGTLVVHGDVEAARIADGVHLPANANVALARERLGPESLIGLSCHTIRDVEHAEGADYVTLGPVAPTSSKIGYEALVTRDEFARACEVGIPIVALGGVDETNLHDTKRTGVAGFAVMGSVMRSDEPGELIRTLLAAWTRNS